MALIDKFRSKLSTVLFNSLPGAVLSINDFSNTIFMYHGVDRIGNTTFNNRHTGVKCLDAHVAFLKKYCNVVSISDFFEGRLINNKINVVITFDDGYVNNFRYALPVFEKYKVPAAYFITGLNQSEYPLIWADFLNIVDILTDREVKIDGETFSKKKGIYHSSETGVSLYELIKRKKAGWDFKQKLQKAFSREYSQILRRKEFVDYWQLMTDDEIRQMSKSTYVEIGSHGFFHNDLGKIPLENAREELVNSKGYLENLIQKEVVSLGYPDGSYSAEVKSVAETLGFKYQMAADGFICSEDKDDSRIRNRAGVYTCGRCGTQLLDAFKNMNR